MLSNKRTQWLASQLRTPRGLGGIWVGWKMNRLNHAMNESAYRALLLAPQDQVLEIGFGGGCLLDKILRGPMETFVDGIDISTTMVQRARQRFREQARLGRLRLRASTLEAHPEIPTGYDKIVSVNTIYFWKDLDASLLRIAALLAPTGTLVLGYRPESSLSYFPVTKYGFFARSTEVIEEHLTNCGFRILSNQVSSDQHTPFNTLTATKIIAN